MGWERSTGRPAGCPGGLVAPPDPTLTGRRAELDSRPTRDWDALPSELPSKGEETRAQIGQIPVARVHRRVETLEMEERR